MVVCLMTKVSVDMIHLVRREQVNYLTSHQSCHTTGHICGYESPEPFPARHPVRLKLHAEQSSVISDKLSKSTYMSHPRYFTSVRTRP